MKKRKLPFIFALIALAAVFIAGGCDIYNPWIDTWWEGETPVTTQTISRETHVAKYVITFDSNGGTYRDLVNTPKDLNPWTQEISPGLKASEPGLVDGPDGKEYLAGWFKTKAAADDPVNNPQDKWNFSELPTGSMTLYAGWANAGKTITFNPNPPADSSLTFSDCNYTPLPEKIAENSFLTEPKQFGLKTTNPLAVNYYFDGWYTDNDNDGDIDDEAATSKWDFSAGTASDTVDLYDGNNDDKITLYAKWSQKDSNTVYTVTFDAGGAEGGSRAVPPAQNIHNGETISRPNALIKTDYVFNGWYEDGSTTPWDFTSGQVTGDLTLRARWTLQPYSPTYFVENGYNVIAKYPGEMTYYPFQFDQGEDDFSGVYDGDGDSAGLDEELDNEENQEAVIDLLKNKYPNAVAVIKGYSDPNTPDPEDTLIKNREANIYSAFYEETGVAAGRLIKFTGDSNSGAGPVGSDGNEVRVYIFNHP